MAKTIGEILRSARAEAGLSLRDLSRLTGMSSGSISQIENGVKRAPAFTTVLRLSRAIGISLEELATRLEGGSATATRTSGAFTASMLAQLEKAEAQTLRASKLLHATLIAVRSNKPQSGRSKK